MTAPDKVTVSEWVSQSFTAKLQITSYWLFGLRVSTQQLIGSFQAERAQTAGLTWAEQSGSSEQAVLGLRHPQRLHAVEEVEHWAEEILTTSWSHQQETSWLTRSNVTTVSGWVLSGLTWTEWWAAVDVFLRLYVPQPVVCWCSEELQSWRQRNMNASDSCRFIWMTFVTSVSPPPPPADGSIHLDWDSLGCRRTAELRAETWPPERRLTTESSGLRSPGGQNLKAQCHSWGDTVQRYAQHCI